MPEIIIVAGPNGAGKTSFARQFLGTARRSFAFANADEIAREAQLRGLSQTHRDLQATRLMLMRMDEFTEARHDFIVETTLAAKSYLIKIENWQRIGYRVRLIFIRLPNADSALERVKRRVAAGGHSIPEATIRRRYQLGLENLQKHYKPIVDAWYIFDSLEGSFALAESSATS